MEKYKITLFHIFQDSVTASQLGSIHRPRIEQQFYPVASLEARKGILPTGERINIGDQRRGPHTAVSEKSQRSAPGGGDGGIAAGDPQLLHADLIEIPSDRFAEESDLGILAAATRKGQQGKGGRSCAGALEDDVGA